MIGLFCRISSLLYGSFTKETHNLKQPIKRNHPIIRSVAWHTEDGVMSPRWSSQPQTQCSSKICVMNSWCHTNVCGVFFLVTQMCVMNSSHVTHMRVINSSYVTHMCVMNSWQVTQMCVMYSSYVTQMCVLYSALCRTHVCQKFFTCHTDTCPQFFICHTETKVTSHTYLGGAISLRLSAVVSTRVVRALHQRHRGAGSSTCQIQINQLTLV